MNKVDEKAKISVFSYENYRVYLADICSWLKENRRGFSFRNLARLSGFRSPNFIQQVIKGEKNLAADSIDRLSRALKLTAEEMRFFRALVLFTQATTTEEKSHHAETLIRARPFRKINPLKASELKYYSRWYAVPLREMVAMEGFCEDPAWIAAHMEPPITAQEASQALKELADLGLVTRDADRKLVPSSVTLSTGDDVSNAFVRQYHQEMIRKAGEAMDRFPSTERDVSCLTLKLSSEKYRRVIERLRAFRKEILQIETEVEEATERVPERASDRTSERVYQVNFQFFPMTKEI